MKYGKRSVWKKIIASPLSLIVLLIVIFVLGRAVLNIYKKANNSETKLTQAQLELVKLKAYQDEVSRKVNQLSTEQGIEAEIRTKFHAIKEGESVAVIIDRSQTAGAGNASSTEQIREPLSWWGRLLSFFGL